MIPDFNPRKVYEVLSPEGVTREVNGEVAKSLRDNHGWHITAAHPGMEITYKGNTYLVKLAFLTEADVLKSLPKKAEENSDE